MSHAPTRRGLALGLAALPVAAAVPAVALPAGPSDLARACIWATERGAYINATAGIEDWPDERTNAEVGATRAVIRRAIQEPSASLADAVAKAQLALADFLDAELPFTDMAEDDLSEGDRLVVAVLRDVIALGGQA